MNGCSPITLWHNQWSIRVLSLHRCFHWGCSLHQLYGSHSILHQLHELWPLCAISQADNITNVNIRSITLNQLQKKRRLEVIRCICIIQHNSLSENAEKWCEWDVQDTMCDTFNVRWNKLTIDFQHQSDVNDLNVKLMHEPSDQLSLLVFCSARELTNEET